MTKLVSESLNEYVSTSSRVNIPIKKDKINELKSEYPKIFGTLSFGIIANEIQVAPQNNFVNGKLDLNRFYNYIKSKGFKRSFDDMKQLIMEAAPLLGITDYLKLSKEEKSDLKFREKYIYNKDFPIDYYEGAEIPGDRADRLTDFALRSAEGETETAYYRFDKPLSQHERNMLKVAYVYKHGDPTKTPWQNYLDARPVTLGHVQKFKKSVTNTKSTGDFKGETYD